MNILNKLTNKNLKLNKNRTLVTIIGISLATALICAVLGMITSFQATMKNVAKTEVGDYHVKFENIPTNQAKYITENNAVEKYYLQSDLCYAKLDKSENEYKPYAYIVGMSSESLSNNGLELTSGRLPENSNEIIIEDTMLSGTLVNYKVGDTITLNYGTRADASGNVLSQSDMLQTDECESESKCDLSSTETITNTTKHTYTIVGIISRVNTTMEGYNAPGYTMITYLSNDELMKENSLSIAVKYKNSSSYEASSTYIIDVLKSNTGNTYKYSKNKNLLEAEGNLDSETLKALYWIGIIIVGIIMVTGIFTTRNAFAISVSEKTKQYGMLSSIGATSKQIKKSVLYEGAYVGTWGIVLGILLGTLAVKILCEVMNIILVDSLGESMKFVYSVPFTAILVAIVISTITIYLSCIIPAKKAARISPIDAIRGKDDIKLNAKKLKTTRLFKKVLGIGGTIAKKNLKRSRKKYRTTVVSLVVSISIFISLFTFIDYGNKISNMQYSGMKYNLSIYGGTEEAYNEYKKLDNIQDYIYQCSESATINYKKFGTDFLKNVISESGKNEETPSTITFINSEYFKKYVKLLGLNENDYKNITILNNISMEYNSNDNKVIRNKLFNIKDGDTLSATLSTNKDETDIKITKVINEYNNNLPLGNESIYYGTRGQIFASLDSDLAKEIKNLDKSRGVIYIKSSNATVTQKEIESIDKEKNLTGNSIENSEELEKQMQSLLLVVSIFLYGFIIVISLIGVTNIFNTITTNMILRSKEFAMLKSIGMTSKEFNRMIRLESLMYGLKSLAIRIPIGLLGSYGIYKAISSRMELGYMVPWSAIIISIIFVFVIVSLTLKYSLNKINKQNIIDTIRNDNM